MSVQVNGTKIEVIVDTGASTDIVDEATFSTVNQLQNIQLQTSTKRLFVYSSDSQLKVLGKFDAIITFKNRSQISKIHVLQGNHGSLLSYQTAADLGVIDVHVNMVNHKPPRHEQGWI